MDGGQVARLLIGAGLAIALVGAALLVANRLGIGLGRLPGDLTFGTDRFRVYVPIVSCIVVSIIATVLLNLFVRR